MSQVFWRGLLARDLAGIFFSTSPPMIGFIAALVAKIRRVPIAYWAMDLNPDQLVAMGKLKHSQPTTRLLEAVNRMILRNSKRVIVLDRFMADRLSPRANLKDTMVIIPPWPHETFVEPVPHGTNPFRQRHGLNDKFVVMYSGNHSPSNPLETVLEAAEHLQDDSAIRFLFVGGGIGKKTVEAFVAQRKLVNVLCLPYQPLEELGNSLSAADVHVVSLGENMVGIIHPCKVYGAMTVARPVLFLGPRPSHVSDLLEQHEFGLRVAHGDINGAVGAIQSLRNMAPEKRDQMGRAGQQALTAALSQQILCGKLCDELEDVFGS
jgi:putative colanic acid biosynthesis glycosyltransferase WcaI